MAKYKLSKEWIRKNKIRIKEAYSSASVRGLDVTSQTDILKLLKIVDPENATEGNAEIFSKVLQLFALGVKKKFESKPKIRPKTVN